MKIKLIFFAQLRDLFESDSKEIEVEDGMTVKKAVSSTLSGPGAEKVRALPLRFAVNECFEDENRILHDGDVLAVMAPMAGG